MTYRSDEPEADPTDLRGVEVRRHPQRDRDRRRISDSLDGLDKGLHLLGEQLDRLDEVLAPVLGPARPTITEGMLRGDSDEASPLRDRLDRQAESLAHAARHLGDRLDRVEL